MNKFSVYEIELPEYKVETTDKPSKLITIPFGATIPEWYEKNKPDFRKIGKEIDKIVKKHFLNKNIAIRTLGSQEHNDKSADDLIEIIKKNCHDRYDPKRKGDRYENIENKHIEFFALPFKIKKKGEYIRWLIEPFYYWPIQDRNYPVRVDILIVYDLSKLEVVEHQYKGREGEIKKDGFVFKDEKNKKDALLAIIKIK
ncbi:hypothetical protein JXC34_04505 [Candidatus Woesearchaeota archaeon]|nr:hypothetical protein [Candidatus Woesearchaeota archaeon]